MNDASDYPFLRSDPAEDAAGAIAGLVVKGTVKVNVCIVNSAFRTRHLDGAAVVA